MLRSEYDQSALFLRAVLALGRRLRASRSPGTRTLPGLGVLGTLYRLGPLVATQLAAEEGLRPQSLTRMLAELERDRLISRKQSSADGRAVTITLTARGRNKLLDEIAERQAWLNAAMSMTLTPDERQTAHAAAIVMLKLGTYESTDGSTMTAQRQSDEAPAVVDKNLSRASYTNVKLENATFTDVNLKGAAFCDVNLSGATFEDVNLANAAIRNANLNGMTINGIPVPEMLDAFRNRYRTRGASDEREVESAESTAVAITDETPVIDLTSAALLVIDVQKAIDAPYHAAHGPRNNPAAESNIALLLSAWRRRGSPVIHIRHDSTSAESSYRPGQEGNEFKLEVAPIEGERVVPKRTNSAFIGTDLERTLRDAGLATLVVTGVSTNNSVEATVRMAGNLGFETCLVADACFTFARPDFQGRMRTADEVHAMSLANLDGEYCKVVNTADVLAAETAKRTNGVCAV